MAAVQSLDYSYRTAHAELLAEWPSALESPALDDELPKLAGTLLICLQNFTHASSESLSIR